MRVTKAARERGEVNTAAELERQRQVEIAAAAVAVTQHTPGPWRVEDEGAGLLVRSAPSAEYPRGRFIARVARGRDGETDNARLIAAAPRLAVALRRMLASPWCDFTLAESREARSFDQAMLDAVIEARAALADADGEPGASTAM